MLSTRLLPALGDEQYFAVLLPAFPLSSRMWGHMISEIEDMREDTTFLLIDFPGFGASPAQADWTMPGVAQEIHDAIELNTRKKVILIGLSMGGYAALAFYREYPGLVRALVLSNTKAAADTEEAKAARETFALDALARGADAAIERLYSGFVTENTDPEVAIEIRNWMAEANPEAIAAGLRAMAARQDSTDLLSVIGIPSLVITGSLDTIIIPAVVQEMATHLQDSTFVSLHEAAHLTAVERPREWAEALSSFLDRL